MARSIKTAVSLPAELFDQAEALADQMRVSRSRLFALALEDLLRRHENRGLLERINAVYAAAPDRSERKLLEGMRRQHRRLLEAAD